MAPLTEYHKVSKGIRAIAEPEVDQSKAGEPKAIALKNDPKVILDVIAHIRERAGEIKALIGQDPLTDLERSLAILERETDRTEEEVGEIRELVFFQVKNLVALIIRTEAARKEKEVADKKIKQLEASSAALEREANRDPLTNLYNKRGLSREGRRMFEYCRKNAYPLSCLYIDIDYFKLVNDRYGHDVGDAILKAFGETIAEEFRDSDIVFQENVKRKSHRRKKSGIKGDVETKKAPVVGKDGGDEVVVLMPYTDVAEAAAAAERLRKRIQNMKFSITKRNGQVKTFTIDLTCTIGVSEADFTTQSLKETKSFADSALKTGKAHGRNIVCITPRENPGLSYGLPYQNDPDRKKIGKVGRYAHTDSEEGGASEE